MGYIQSVNTRDSNYLPMLGTFVKRGKWMVGLKSFQLLHLFLSLIFCVARESEATRGNSMRDFIHAEIRDTQRSLPVS